MRTNAYRTSSGVGNNPIIGAIAALTNSYSGRPDLELYFGGGNTDGSVSALDSRLSYTSRGGNATQYDSQGRLVWAPANMQTYSNTFSDASWAKSGITPSYNVAVSPSGASDATQLITTNATTLMGVNAGTPAPAGMPSVQSWYVKAKSGVQYVQLLWTSGAVSNDYANFDIIAGTLVGGTYLTAGIVSVDNGWYRIWLGSAIGTAGGGWIIAVPASNSVRATSFPGDGVAGWYIYGAQVELRGIDSPKAYNATTGSAYYAPRLDYDPGSLQPKGLFLEEAGTNLLTWSTDLNNAAWTKTDTTVSTSAVIGPDGFPVQILTEGTATTAVHYQFGTIPLATDFFCHSRYLKRGNHDWVYMEVSDGTNGAKVWFNLALGTIGVSGAVVLGAGTNQVAFIEPVGNGWFRCTLIAKGATVTSIKGATFSASADNSTTRVNNATRYEFGPQLEAVSGAATRWASSYIPTYSATVTRNADNILSVSTAGWFSAVAGTAVVECSAPPMPAGTQAQCWGFNDGSANKRIFGQLIPNGLQSQVGYRIVNTTDQYNAAASGNLPNWQQKQAATWNTADINQYDSVGGSNPLGSGTIPTGITTLCIGGSVGNGTVSCSRWIKSFKYYARRRTNAELQVLADLTATPQLSLSFITALDRRLMWTDRGSNATQFDAQGRLVWAPANMFSQSGTFSAAIGMSVAASPVLGPNGIALQAFTGDGTPGSHYGNNSSSFSSTTGDTCTFSCLVASSTNDFVQLLTNTAVSVGYANFRLSTGQAVALGGATAATISTVPGYGWRLSVTIPITAGNASTTVYISAASSIADIRLPNFAYSGTIILGQCQAERTGVDSPKPFIYTSGSTVYSPRLDYDPVTKAPLGILLEEARTNVLAYGSDLSNGAWARGSGAISTMSSVPAPDGISFAAKLIAPTSLSIPNIQQTGLASSSYTLSFFAKAGEESTVSGWHASASVGATFTLSGSGTVSNLSATAAGIYPIGNGWYRCWVYYSGASTTAHIYCRSGAAFTGDGASGVYLWGAQLEAGSFPTSYIPTYNASATRAKDTPPWLSTVPWFAQAASTYVAAIRGLDVAGASSHGILGYSNSQRVMYSASGAFSAYDGVNVPVFAGGVSNNVDYRIAAQFAGVGARGSVNKGAIGSGTWNSTLSGSALYIGDISGGTNPFNGWISQVSYYGKSTFTDAQIQGL